MLVFFPNPHTSAPTIGIPNIYIFNIPPTDYNIKSQEEILSPNQWAANLPEPEDDALVRINGSF